MSHQYIAVRALNRSSQIRVVAFTRYEVVVDATGGDWKLTITGQIAGASDTTADVAHDVSAANLKTALTNTTTNPDITASNVTVTGGPGDDGGTTPYYIAFYGTLLDQGLILTAANGSSPLTGGEATATASRIGQNVKLSPTVDTIVDLDNPTNRRALGNHSAFGQFIVTAANDDIHNDALPPNS